MPDLPDVSFITDILLSFVDREPVLKVPINPVLRLAYIRAVSHRKRGKRATKKRIDKVLREQEKKDKSICQTILQKML